ncbi:MAG: class I SAM-dependent methyltransferase [Pseudomonadota bacterium]
MLEYDYIVAEGLNAQEKAALASVADKIRNSRILDIGVGAGRTVRPLRAISENYLGVDYVQEMVEHCRAGYPGVRFERLDAREMSTLKAESFDLVFFSCNGICMVDHAGRIAILKEVRRVLAAGGVFIFSACNRNSPQYEIPFHFPDFQRTSNPVKLLVRAARFVTQVGYRLINRRRNRRHEIRTDEYAVINDVYHHYRTMLYFIDLPRQHAQLSEAGFAGGVATFDLSGRPADNDCRDGTVIFVVSKS